MFKLTYLDNNKNFDQNNLGYFKTGNSIENFLKETS